MNETAAQLPLESSLQESEGTPRLETETALADLAGFPQLNETGNVSKEEEAHRLALQVFERSSDWVTFFRVVLGKGGVIPRLFRSGDEMAEFKKGTVYPQIHQMLATLRERSKHSKQDGEPMRVITVRLPASLHEALRDEAHDRKTSMNQLCISKLLQMIDDNLVPTD